MSAAASELLLPATWRDVPPALWSEEQPVVPTATRLLKAGAAPLRDGQCAQLSAQLLDGLWRGDGAIRPLSAGYAGHQFGHFVPSLGDGRAHLLGEVIGADDLPLEVQLKGSGRTVWSRGGDGRATLGAMLREHLLGECLHALGVPTTRSLALWLTGETVPRERVRPGAILVRAARSHVRVGSFQYLACRGDTDGVRRLADWCIARHDPDLVGQVDGYLRFYARVVARQAALLARWMAIGFVHGVMNTDNMTVSGETIDFGPCAFLDGYRSEQVFSSIDHQGRYAYGRQPAVAQWNLARLAECLLPLFAHETDAAVTLAEEALGAFAALYARQRRHCYRARLGLTAVVADAQDDALIDGLLALLETAQADYLTFMRQLAEQPEGAVVTPLADAFGLDGVRLCDWHERWQLRRQAEPGPPAGARALRLAANPIFVARNHRVEAAILAAEEHADYGPFERLLAVISDPFTESTQYRELAAAPKPEERVLQTFCGT